MKSNLIIKLAGIASIFVTILFVVGLIVLFFVNPPVYYELNAISLSAYNLDGMVGRLWAVLVIYVAVGTLNTLLFICLLFEAKRIQQKIGIVLFLVAGICWLTFGLFLHDPSSFVGNSFLLLRITFIVAATGAGLIIFSIDQEEFLDDRLLKSLTRLSGFIILSLGLTSIFFDDSTWIRTNISFTIYFLWIGIFGLRYLRNASLLRGRQSRC